MGCGEAGLHHGACRSWVVQEGLRLARMKGKVRSIEGYPFPAIPDAHRHNFYRLLRLL